MKMPLLVQLFFVFMLCIPANAHAAVFLQAAIQLRAEILSFLNVGLFITAVISFKQFFWPGDNNTLPFQVFNMIFAGLFYGVGLPFLVANRAYYEGYENLLPIDVLGKFFLSINFSSIAQWFIVASVIVNVLYIIRFRKDYYEAGIASSGNEDKMTNSVQGYEPLRESNNAEVAETANENMRTTLSDTVAEEEITHLRHNAPGNTLPADVPANNTEDVHR